MNDHRAIDYWQRGLAVAGLVVGLVVVLLLAIITTAAGIQANVARIKGAAKKIVRGTQPIWGLSDTDQVMSEILQTSRSIERHAVETADGLEQPTPAAG
ncbi:MAG: hypothetical protein ACYC1C_13570 [Chloroflexota bacterium]